MGVVRSGRPRAPTSCPRGPLVRKQAGPPKRVGGPLRMSTFDILLFLHWGKHLVSAGGFGFGQSLLRGAKFTLELGLKKLLGKHGSLSDAYYF